MDEKSEVKKRTSNGSEVKKSTSKSTTTKKAKTTGKKFTNKEKDQLVIILLVIVIAVVVIILFSSSKKASNDNSNSNMGVQNEQNNTEVNGSTEVNNNAGVTEAKQIDDLKIDNIQVKKENGITYIFADITNTGKEKQGGFKIHISMKDENDKEIIGFEKSIPVLSSGEKTNISVGSTDEFVNAYKCTITKAGK